MNRAFSQEHRRQDGDDGDGNQKLDECERRGFQPGRVFPSCSIADRTSAGPEGQNRCEIVKKLSRAGRNSC